MSLFVHIDWQTFLTETFTQANLPLISHSNELLWETGMNKWREQCKDTDKCEKLDSQAEKDRVITEFPSPSLKDAWEDPFNSELLYHILKCLIHKHLI